METDNHRRVGGVTVGVSIKDDGRGEERIGGCGGTRRMTQGLLADSAYKGDTCTCNDPLPTQNSCGLLKAHSSVCVCAAKQHTESSGDLVEV